MVKSKNQNSILFLTTLGVYLGLVLAGATPQVVAQRAAMARSFDITDEIEAKDDLDNKPDGEITVLDQIADLLGDLNEFAKKGQLDWTVKNDLSIEDYSICESDNSDSYLAFGDLDSLPGKRFQKAGISIARNLIDEKVKAKAGTKFAGWPETINLRFFSDASDIRFETSVSASDTLGAKNLAFVLAKYLSARVADKARTSVGKLAKRTTTEVKDVKVILVTRLPRSDLDALLAKDAK